MLKFTVFLTLEPVLNYEIYVGKVVHGWGIAAVAASFDLSTVGGTHANTVLGSSAAYRDFVDVHLFWAEF